MEECEKTTVRPSHQDYQLRRRNTLMNPSILRPQADVPLIVRLKKAEGLEKNGLYGTDYQYFVQEGTMYLPPPGREALLRSNAQAGDQVEILKSSQGFKVKVLSTALVTAQPGQPVKANGAALPALPDSDIPEPSMCVTSRHYMGCLCAAIDAVSEAQEYGRKRGLGITFLGNDIRAIATTFYIDDRRRDEVR